MALLWGVITFSLLVVIHEGGHFALARLFKIKVTEFMIGLPGPALRRRSRKSGTVYGITMVPLGGYVKITGMEPGAEDPRLAAALAHVTGRGSTDALELSHALEVSPEHAAALLATLLDWGAVEPVSKDSGAYRPLIGPLPGEGPSETLDRARATTFRGHPTWQRISILAAGVVFNLVTAWLIFTVTLSAFGYDVPSLTLESVVPGKPAAQAGMRAGDRVVAIDGKRLADWTALQTQIQKHKAGQTAAVTVKRGARELTFQVKLASREGKPFLGVGSGLEKRRFTVLGAARESLVWTGLVFAAIAQFFNPKTFATSIEGARSVVGISYEVAKAAEAGPIQYAWMVAFLSLSLGALNILPLPPLDGGKVLMEIIERIWGRPLKREFVLAFSAFGVLLLFSLIFYLLYADVMRYIVR